MKGHTQKGGEIIEKGRGTDFDPIVADAFLAIRDKVEQIHRG